MNSSAPSPKIILIGGGAAGLWTAMSLLDNSWSGEQLTVLEPSGKTEDDRTWSYWAKESLFPPSVAQSAYDKIVLASDGKRSTYKLTDYQYFSIRSSEFYAYAKGVLAKAGVTWINKKALSSTETADGVEVLLDNNERLNADYVLDSRPPDIEVPSTRYNATLQHFGGWFVKMPSEVFNPDEVVFMDFIDVSGGVAFFYVIPSSTSEALVEIAVFSPTPWSQEAYDHEIQKYIIEKFGRDPRAITQREYGIIPMTDQPLWKASTHRIWNIGTRGGWVQPSSGYAFTRTARFAQEVAVLLSQTSPTPWKPSATQQVFNSVMLGYIIDNPTKAGSVFSNLFANNGPKRTFDFLDEKASLSQTVKLMWSAPQGPFAVRAFIETIARLRGVK